MSLLFFWTWIDTSVSHGFKNISLGPRSGTVAKENHDELA
jgi:hypothetical protein